MTVTCIIIGASLIMIAVVFISNVERIVFKIDSHRTLISTARPGNRPNVPIPEKPEPNDTRLF